MHHVHHSQYLDIIRVHPSENVRSLLLYNVPTALTPRLVQMEYIDNKYDKKVTYSGTVGKFRVRRVKIASCYFELVEDRDCKDGIIDLR